VNKKRRLLKTEANKKSAEEETDETEFGLDFNSIASGFPVGVQAETSTLSAARQGGTVTHVSLNGGGQIQHAF
jgi:hypothetical protein